MNLTGSFVSHFRPPIYLPGSHKLYMKVSEQCLFIQLATFSIWHINEKVRSDKSQLVSAACARSMIHHKTPGSIIFLGSIAGVRVLHPQQQCAYNASKAGVIHLCKSLAAEWAPHGIRCNTISPGYMDTELNNEANLEEVKQHWCVATLY